MNCYEHTIIAKQDLSESQNQKLVDKYEKIINKNIGKVLKTEKWGLRTLAYKIKNNKKGFYFHIKFEGVGKTIEELERNLKIMTDYNKERIEIEKQILNLAISKDKKTKENLITRPSKTSIKSIL